MKTAKDSGSTVALGTWALLAGGGGGPRDRHRRLRAVHVHSGPAPTPASVQAAADPNPAVAATREEPLRKGGTLMPRPAPSLASPSPRSPCTDLAAAGDLATHDIRGGVTRAQWMRGELPDRAVPAGQAPQTTGTRSSSPTSRRCFLDDPLLVPRPNTAYTPIRYDMTIERAGPSGCPLEGLVLPAVRPAGHVLGQGLRPCGKSPLRPPVLRLDSRVDEHRRGRKPHAGRARRRVRFVDVKARGYWEQIWIRLRRDRLAVPAGGITIILLFLIAFIGAPVVAQILGHGPKAQFFAHGVDGDTFLPVGPWRPPRPSGGPTGSKHELLALRADSERRPRPLPPAPLRRADVARGRGVRHLRLRVDRRADGPRSRATSAGGSTPSSRASPRWPWHSPACC